MRSTLKLELAHLFEVEAKRTRDPRAAVSLRYDAADMRRSVKLRAALRKVRAHG